MAVLDVTFPDDISYGSVIGSGWDTLVVQSDGGREEAVQRLSQARRVLECKYEVKTRAILAVIEKLWTAAEGCTHRFRCRDWRDYASTSDGATTAYQGAAGGAAAVTNADVTIGTGDGTTTTFQLVKKYTAGSTTRTRNITRPRTGTVLIAVNGVSKTEGVDFTVNYSTGVVTFMSAPTAGHAVTAGFEFDILARFGLAIDKTGLQWIFVAGDQVEVVSLPVEEVPEGPPVDEDAWTGSGKNIGVIAASFRVDLGLGLYQQWTVNTASLAATMPDATLLPEGFPLLVVKNAGSQSIQIKRADGTNEFSIASGITRGFALLDDGTGTKKWFAW